MPLFRYACDRCHAESELLIRGEAQPVCPKCGSAEIVRQASRFNAVNGGGNGGKQAELAPCGMPSSCCRGGSCGLN